MRASVRMKYVARLAGIITIVIGAAGCGGGGGGGNNASNLAVPPGLVKLQPGVTSAITPTLLPLISGDEWYYSITGNTEQSSGAFVGISRGSLTRSIANYIDVNGISDGVSITDQTNILYDNKTQVVTNLITDVIQDPTTPTEYDEWADNAEASGNQEEAGNDNCPGDGTPMAIMPGIWNASTGISSASAFFVPTGSPTISSTTDVCTPASKLTNQEQFNLSVVGTATETITVPAGTFETWKVVSGSDYVTQGTVETDTAWWAPQIGAFVQKIAKIQNNSTGSVSSFTYQLVGFKSQAQVATVRLAK